MQRVFNLQTKGLGGWFYFWKHWNWVLKIKTYFLLTFFSYSFLLLLLSLFFFCFFLFFFFFKKQPLTASFLKNRCSFISKTYKYNSRSGWGFWRMSVGGGGGGGLFLVKFQSFRLIVCCLTGKWVLLGHFQKNFTWILGAFFFSRKALKWLLALVCCFCCCCFFLMFFFFFFHFLAMFLRL